MRKINLSPFAEQDLEEIWLYTNKKWSSQQADKYQDDLFGGFERLASDINLGISVEEIRSGYRNYKVNRHLIFYTASDSDKSITIVRILHEQMDVPRHLQ